MLAFTFCFFPSWFLVSVYRHLYSLLPCACVRALVREADVEHMFSLKRRAEEGIPSSRLIQVCLSDKFATHV